MPAVSDPRELFRQTFGGEGEIGVVSVPGRVNLIGEHIDYHGLPVLPIAIKRYVRVAFRPRQDRLIRAVSTAPYLPREFQWTSDLAPAAPGDWQNYLRAAAQVVSRMGEIGKLKHAPRGIDAVVVSDLPAAAGLSSSTALLVAFTLALLRVNHCAPTFDELMAVLPDGEQFVGTRGGGMDHAAVLASQPGCASLIDFQPLSVRPIPIPLEWSFLVAHSLEAAEKSGGAREAYNARRRAGTTALQRLGFPSYRVAVEGHTLKQLETLVRTPRSAAGPPAGLSAEDINRGPAGAPHQTDSATLEEQDSFLHVTGEAFRVQAAVSALNRQDPATFGHLLLKSHASLRDRLKVSCPALDRLVEAAMESGAMGARLTGAGFGGCAVIFTLTEDRPDVRRRLIDRYYSGRPDFHEDRHLIDADPGPGVLNEENHATPHP
ncbi:MAG TPA: galactokinase family protein [Bryobacteraceae bacterium]|nr:galactokinase family protein [Bryobacteraceae bacterium]